MKRLIVIGLVTCMAAGAVNAQMVVEPTAGDWEYSTVVPRGPWAYLEDTMSGYYWDPGGAGYDSMADDIHFFDGTAPIHMTDFHVAWYSRITAGLTPITMDVCFYAFEEDELGCVYIGNKKYAHYTVTGLGTGLRVTDVDVSDHPYLPCDVWMQVCFTDKNGNPAVDTGCLLAQDKLAEVGGTSKDIMLVMGDCCTEPPTVLGGSWFGGYETTPYWNPAANFLLGVTVPEPLTLGLVALGGLLAIRRRR